MGNEVVAEVVSEGIGRRLRLAGVVVEICRVCQRRGRVARKNTARSRFHKKELLALETDAFRRGSGSAWGKGDDGGVW